MTRDEINKLLDTLTQEQRDGIARMIRDADIKGSWEFNGEDSVWEEDAEDTLETLAHFISNYDPKSVLE